MARVARTPNPRMDTRARQPIDPSTVICVVMGGGTGQGLFPLTRDRAVPAVPLAGNYRLVDVPISNCINSGFRQIYVLTQFNTASLHRHVSEAYKFDHFSDGFVEIRAAQRTFTDSSWYRGTADAVRKNLSHFLSRNFEYALVLSADQLYRQDFRPLVAQHIATGADLTIGTVGVPRAEACRVGILKVDGERRVREFVEKPTDPAVLDSLNPDRDCAAQLGLEPATDLLLGSAGIYVFSRQVLQGLLDNAHPDFGKDILPHAPRSHQVFSYLLQGYWKDIGAMGAFFEANLDLVTELPHFNFFDLTAPIYSQPLYLPGAKVNNAQIDHALLGGGCIIDHSTISHSIVGLRTVIGAGCHLHRVISMGVDYYETRESIAAHEKMGLPRIGIGRNTRIENAIVDRNARIGDGVVLTPAGKPAQVDHEHYFIRDGIVIVPRNGVVPHGTII
jgi:glucose-1-phosphate adenylyltransferase